MFCLSPRKKLKKSTFLWYVFNFASARLFWNNLYALRVLCKTWHLSRKVSLHMSSADYCTLSNKGHFQDNNEIKDSSLVSKLSLQLAKGSSLRCMISSFWNDSSWPCGEVHPLLLRYAITGSFVLFTVQVASFSSAHPPTTSTREMSGEPKSWSKIHGGQPFLIEPLLLKASLLRFFLFCFY